MGLRGHLDLAARNILIGPNGVGKTRRVEGVQFAVTGVALGAKKPDSIMALTNDSGTSLAVSLVLDDGFAFTRTLRKDANTKTVKSGLDIVGQEGLGVTASEPIVRQRCGDFAPMFDLGEFLGLSADKRRDFVLDLCSKASGDKVDADDVGLRVLVEVLKGQVGEATVDVYCQTTLSLAGCKSDTLSKAERYELVMTQNPVSDQLPAAFAEKLGTAMAQIQAEIKGDLTTAIAAALDKARSLANQAKGDRDRAHQAVRKLSEQLDKITVVAATVGQLQEQLTERRTDKEGIVAQLANQAGRASAKSTLETAVSEAETALDTAKDELDALPKPPEHLEVGGWTSEALNFNSPIETEPGMAPTEEHAKGVMAALAASQRALETRRREHQAAKFDLDQLTKELQSLAASPWRKVLALANAVYAAAHSEPATKVLTYTDEWGALLEFIIQQSEPERLKAAEDDCSAGHNAEYQASIEYNKADECYAAARKTLEEAERELAALQYKRASIRYRNAQRNELTKQRELNDLQSAGGHVPTDQLEQHQTSLEGSIEQLEAQIQAKQGVDQLNAQLLHCKADAESEAVQHEVCKAIADAIRVIREGIMADLVKPLLVHMSKFLDGAAPGRRAYCDLINDRGRPIFQLGWIEDDCRKVPLEALGGGSTCIFYAGLAYALVMLADPPLKLLLLEVAELDVERMAKLLDGLDAVADDLSNIIVATCHEPDEMPAADWGRCWKVVHLEAEPAETAMTT